MQQAHVTALERKRFAAFSFSIIKTTATPKEVAKVELRIVHWPLFMLKNHRPPTRQATLFQDKLPDVKLKDIDVCVVELRFNKLIWVCLDLLADFLRFYRLIFGESLLFKSQQLCQSVLITGRQSLVVLTLALHLCNFCIYIFD